MANARQKLKALEQRHEKLRRAVKNLTRPKWYQNLSEKNQARAVRTVLRDILFRDDEGANGRTDRSREGRH